MDNLFFALQITRGGFTRNNISCKINTYIYIVGKCTEIMIYLQKNTGMEKDKNKNKIKDKQARNLRYLIYFFSGIAVIMLGIYAWNFPCPFSENQADWGAFGAYMGSITGLLAFIGVLYTIRQSSLQVTARDERDLFFRLMDEHRQTRDSLTFPDENKKGVAAIDAYVEDINKDFQLITILTSSLGRGNFQEWVSSIRFQGIGIEEATYNLMYEDLIINILECISALQVLTEFGKGVDLTKLHDSDPEVKYGTCEQCFPNTYHLIKVIEEGTLDTGRFDYAKIPDAQNLAFVARMIWWHKLDDLGRSRALEYTANVFYKKHLVPITYYFNNLGYITYTLNNFIETNKDYYMKYWRSKFSADEIYLLLFYLASDKLDVDILQTVIDYKLFDNLGTRDLVDLKQQNFDGVSFSYKLMQTIIQKKEKEEGEKEEN